MLTTADAAVQSRNQYNISTTHVVPVAKRSSTLRGAKAANRSTTRTVPAAVVLHTQSSSTSGKSQYQSVCVGRSTRGCAYGLGASVRAGG
eukprot:254605-Rhodomonas_salina.2